MMSQANSCATLRAPFSSTGPKYRLAINWAPATLACSTSKSQPESTIWLFCDAPYPKARYLALAGGEDQSVSHGGRRAGALGPGCWKSEGCCGTTSGYRLLLAI